MTGVVYQPHDYLVPGDLTFIWPVVFLTFMIVLYAYEVPLKRSRFRTIGYPLAGAQIVTLQGERPSLGSLSMRLLFAIFGPFNFLLDLLWISSDPVHQALRDKFAHTYLVRKDAVPSAAGEIVYGTYTVFGWWLLVKEVRRAPPLPAAAPS